MACLNFLKKVPVSNAKLQTFFKVLLYQIAMQAGNTTEQNTYLSILAKDEMICKIAE